MEWLSTYWNWLTDPDASAAIANLQNKIQDGTVTAEDLNRANGLVGTINEVVNGAVAQGFAALINFMPTGGGFPQAFHDAAIAFGNVYQAMSFIFPTDVLAYCIVLVIEVRLALWCMQILVRIFNWLRGVNTERMTTDFGSIQGVPWRVERP